MTDMDSSVEPPQPYGPVEAQALVDKQVHLGRWKHWNAWGTRAHATGDPAKAQLVWMEFVCGTRGNSLFDVKAELKLAGYRRLRIHDVSTKSPAWCTTKGLTLGSDTYGKVIGETCSS